VGRLNSEGDLPQQFIIMKTSVFLAMALRIMAKDVEPSCGDVSDPLLVGLDGHKAVSLLLELNQL